MSDETNEPERLSYEWHALSAEQGAAETEELIRLTDDDDESEMRDHYQAELEERRDLAQKLWQAAMDREALQGATQECGHDIGMQWVDRTVTQQMKFRCAMCDSESLAQANTKLRRQAERAAAEVKRLREMVRDVEWVGKAYFDDEGMVSACPWCSGVASTPATIARYHADELHEGHRSDCPARTVFEGDNR